MSGAGGAPGYSRGRVALHWATAGLFVTMVVLGLTLSRLDPESAARLWLSRAHFALGMATGLTLVVRVIARVRGSSVAPLPLPTAHRRMIAAVHVLLYVVLFAVLGSGMAASFLGGWPSYLSGAEASAPDFEGVLPREGHEVLVFALVALVLVHVAGVAIHEARHGGALQRMLPSRPTQGEPRR